MSKYRLWSTNIVVNKFWYKTQYFLRFYPSKKVLHDFCLSQRVFCFEISWHFRAKIWTYLNDIITTVKFCQNIGPYFYTAFAASSFSIWLDFIEFRNYRYSFKNNHTWNKYKLRILLENWIYSWKYFYVFLKCFDVHHWYYKHR